MVLTGLATSLTMYYYHGFDLYLHINTLPVLPAPRKQTLLTYELHKVFIFLFFIQIYIAFRVFPTVLTLLSIR